jgi:hypothetical protein
MSIEAGAYVKCKCDDHVDHVYVVTGINLVSQEARVELVEGVDPMCICDMQQLIAYYPTDAELLKWRLQGKVSLELIPSR